MIRYICFLAFFFLWGCGAASDEYIPGVPDYADSGLWYVDAGGEEADVFYVTPTCVYDWVEETTGLPCHHYDANAGVMRRKFDYSLALANDIFGASCNFYAPYYRQISLNSWLEDEAVVARRFSVAMADVSSAFKYYLEHYNGGRDFILAGFSQGAKAVLELVKGMDTTTLKKMKVAYVIGYGITADDLANPNVVPAKGETDTGVVIGYNSVRSAEDRWKAVSGDNEVCINPVNWRVDDAAAWISDSISVRVDTLNKVLLVSGYANPMRIRSMEGFIPEGNYHLSELELYAPYLRENVSRRLSSNALMQSASACTLSNGQAL